MKSFAFAIAALFVTTQAGIGIAEADGALSLALTDLGAVKIAPNGNGLSIQADNPAPLAGGTSGKTKASMALIILAAIVLLVTYPNMPEDAMAAISSAL